MNMTPEQINIFNEILSKLNSKQRQIASNLSISKQYYSFTVITINNQKTLYIKEDRTGREFEFISYVKSLCGCD